MTMLRRYIAYGLVAVLLLTGQGMAVARGMPTAVGYMELCTGTGPDMVPVDANGQPTGAPHICPEFSLMLMQGVIADVDLPSWQAPAAPFRPALFTQAPAERVAFAASARGPPVLS
ncbi:hypothetical protein N6L24_07630 [Cognatishimia sp. SS12]|uniref:hypothetical protein n=1 Tax=Cognatishimia sp. SS12 TaxID=2979465 RepID=UPI00232DB379|nr:hypothetical protein [Cognatishimia sp. SS12]MDC0738145.1 hypothetical protein [Cognatishimia sp. SS12]